MTQAHSFLAAEMVLKAQAAAKKVVIPEGGRS